MSIFKSQFILEYYDSLLLSDSIKPLHYRIKRVAAIFPNTYTFVANFDHFSPASLFILSFVDS